MFCPETLALLQPNTTTNTLQFKSDRIGVIYPAKPEDTLLHKKTFGVGTEKFQKTLSVTAYDPVNPRELLKDGCPKCKAKVVTFQRLGDQQVIYKCLCGAQW